MNKERVEQLIRELLIELGEDPNREGLERTPSRVAETWHVLTRGYREDPREITCATLRRTQQYMIIAHNIEIIACVSPTCCPFGRCHIGYTCRSVSEEQVRQIADCYARGSRTRSG